MLCNEKTYVKKNMLFEIYYGNKRYIVHLFQVQSFTRRYYEFVIYKLNVKPYKYDVIAVYRKHCHVPLIPLLRTEYSVA